MATTTLSWFNSGFGAKSGTTIAALLSDVVTLVNSKSGDANFSWQVASSNVATSPYYVVLKRKDLSPGRILLLGYASAPGTNNATLLDTAPTTNALYGSYFPAGNVDSPSNITAASGAVMGDDTGALKVWANMGVASIYAAGTQPFYFDSADAVVFGFQNPTAATTYMAGAGKILVDGADSAYDGVFSLGTGNAALWGNTSNPLPWAATKPAAGSVTACIRTNHGSTDRTYYFAWTPAGSWAAIAVGSTDILTDTSVSKAWFVPVQLLGNTKGEGFVLKLRQIAYGPGTTGPFAQYSTTGPVTAARQFNGATAGGAGHPWFTNFKI
ncbi:MAG: hypothetical protein AzoDbin1_04133 [Azoarcus sp.]|nr:hypothetical protein [Azoarcus sp.]